MCQISKSIKSCKIFIMASDTQIIRAYGHKTFEHKFSSHNTANQNTVPNTTSVLIGRLLSTKVILKIFKMVKPIILYKYPLFLCVSLPNLCTINNFVLHFFF